MKRSGPPMCAGRSGEPRARRSCGSASKSPAPLRTVAKARAAISAGTEPGAETPIGKLSGAGLQMASPPPLPVQHQSKRPEHSSDIACIDTNEEYYDSALIKSLARPHHWSWNRHDKSQACEVGEDPLEVCFHPECSESAAAIRANQPLARNGNFYYWEVRVYDKTYGTSVMFGLCTKQQKLHDIEYCNLVGLDAEGWSLNHKGFIWHRNKRAEFTQTFPSNQPVTVGLLFNTMRGELSYFLNGKNLGIAFYGLNTKTDDLYPVIGSTAKCTRIRLIGSYCGFQNLQQRAGLTLLKHAPDSVKLVNQLHLPKNLVDFLLEIARADGRTIEAKSNNITQHQENNDKQQTPQQSNLQLERQQLNPLNRGRLNDGTTPAHRRFVLQPQKHRLMSLSSPIITYSRIGRKRWKWNCLQSS